MDQPVALMLRMLALAGLALAGVLLLGAFIEYLQRGRWPDQSLLRLAYDHHLIRAYWFLGGEGRLLLRDIMAWLPTPAVALALAPPCWWLGGVLARR